MTKLTKTNDEPEHIYAAVNEITCIQVDGNTTHIEVKVPYMTLENGKSVYDKTVVVEIPTLELVQTFNTSWTNHAIGKLKHWINQLSK